MVSTPEYGQRKVDHGLYIVYGIDPRVWPKESKTCTIVHGIDL